MPSRRSNEGPKNSLGQPIKSLAGGVVKDHADNTARGFAYDGGYMTPSGLPPAEDRNANFEPPGDFSLGSVKSPTDGSRHLIPDFDPLSFNFDSDIVRLNKRSPVVIYSTSLDMARI